MITSNCTGHCLLSDIELNLVFLRHSLFYFSFMGNKKSVIIYCPNSNWPHYSGVSKSYSCIYHGSVIQFSKNFRVGNYILNKRPMDHIAHPSHIGPTVHLLEWFSSLDRFNPIESWFNCTWIYRTWPYFPPLY